MPRSEYTPRELQILWHLKRAGGKITRTTNHSLLSETAYALNMRASTFRHLCADLETRCIILRTYRLGKSATFESGRNNPCTSIELVDPRMDLPYLAPLPAAVIIAHENDELAERLTREPSTEQIVEALIDRALELQKQIDKLQDVVDGLNAENTRLQAQARSRREPTPHLQQRVQSVLTAEQWDTLRGKS
jgi:hypothetical protein